MYVPFHTCNWAVLSPPDLICRISIYYRGDEPRSQDFGWSILVVRITLSPHVSPLMVRWSRPIITTDDEHSHHLSRLPVTIHYCLRRQQQIGIDCRILHLILQGCRSARLEDDRGKHGKHARRRPCKIAGLSQGLKSHVCFFVHSGVSWIIVRLRLCHGSRRCPPNWT